jgi:hypothetical protein
MKTYRGSCHCGSVRFEFDAEIQGAMECNCSICSRAGWLLTFVPASQFRLLAGAEALGDYLFGKKKIHHRFCRTCGVRSFSEAVGPDGRDMRAVNLRCVEDLDLRSLPVRAVDGRSIPV